MEQTQQAETCAICGYHRTVARVVQIGGAPRRVCQICARIGKGLRLQGIEPLVAHCLHLFACEVEHEAENLDLSALALPGRFEARMARRLESGDLRAACECDACRGREPAPATDPLACDAVMILTDLHGFFEVVSEVPGDEMPLQLVRSMRDSYRLTHANGEVWRAVDEIARRVVLNAEATRRGPLSPLAVAAMPRARRGDE